MNALEHELHYEFGEHLPEGGVKFEVAPGIFWVRMPLPFALDHINLWLVREEQSWTLIDCGISSDQIKALWEVIFANHLEGLPISRILCTHMHPDHIGLSGWIQDKYPNARLWMTMGEYSFGRVLSAVMPGANGSSSADHFRRHGMTDEIMLAAIRARDNNYFSSLVPSMPLRFHRIRGDEFIAMGARQWRVIIGTGHSPEHAALYCEKDRLLISGDMVLPRISTNVSVFDIEPESNPVTWYVNSLKAYQDCAADTLVFPSHGRPFKNLHVRIKQLTDHHEDRLHVVLEACKKAPQSAADIVPVMFNRKFDTHQMTFALGESLAHLHALMYTGEVTRSERTDGVVVFSAFHKGNP
jgi:glyoxylase-like metal-dependent hydrolase (beta-lactamase superfamily II)